MRKRYRQYSHTVVLRTRSRVSERLLRPKGASWLRLVLACCSLDFYSTLGGKPSDDSQRCKPRCQGQSRDSTSCAPGEGNGQDYFALIIFDDYPFHSCVFGYFFELLEEFLR